MGVDRASCKIFHMLYEFLMTEKNHLFLIWRLCVIIGKCEVCDVTGVSARNNWLFKSFTVKTGSLLYFVLKSWCWFWFWFWIWGSRHPTPTLVKDSIPVEVFHQITRKMRLKRGWDVLLPKLREDHTIRNAQNMYYVVMRILTCVKCDPPLGEKWKMAPCFCWL